MGLSVLRRAPVTAALLAAIGAMFVLETVLGGSTNQRVLVALGANVWPLHGEYWRLLASMFLHIGVVHVLVNGWALYQLGALFELLVGSGPMAVTYFAAGLSGSAASLWFTLSSSPVSLSAGASGAIFGILGALIAFLLRRRDRLTPMAKSLLLQLLFWAALNVFLGLSSAGIDNSAHMGGCAAGLLIGAFLPGRQPQRPRPEVLPPESPPSSQQHPPWPPRRPGSYDEP
jgi:rhomboid protease GluP